MGVSDKGKKIIQNSTTFKNIILKSDIYFLDATKKLSDEFSTRLSDHQFKEINSNPIKFPQKKFW